MPHIIAKEFTPPALPIEKNGFKFLFKTEGNEGLIGVSGGNYNFLIEFFPHKKGVIIKPDKITRIPNITKIKQSLQALADLCGLEVVHSNIEGKMVEREYKNLISRDTLLKNVEGEKDLWFEIGFGSGRHILHNAETRKDVIHIGVEIHKPSIEQLLKQCEIQYIDNIFVVSDDARVILETFQANSLSKIFVHFPVPWDDSPNKRVFSKNFINQSIRTLKKNGTLELRTDSPNYYNFVTKLYKEMDLNVTIKKNEEIQVVSKYETRWKKQEKDIYDVIFTNSSETMESSQKIDFSFGKYHNIFKKLEQLSDKAVVKDNFLVKINKIYTINKDEHMIKLVMGRHSFPQAIYLKTSGDTLEYYPNKPYFTKENFAAHQKIIEVLEEK